MSEASARPLRHRFALIVLVGVGALVCLAMAWWQWDTYESSGGTAQNLGYALQWPAFAFALVWAYRRFVVFEKNPDEARTSVDEITEIPAGILPERPQVPSASSFAAAPTGEAEDSLREYNRYLSELDLEDRARDQARLASTTSTPTAATTDSSEDQRQ